MAEVFLGEATSVQGFKKRVAIKRVLPHLASHQNFIGMFLDEARLGAKLNHANIVSVFDIGAADNTFFIVMEFVDGANLKKLMESFRSRGEPFPLKDAAYIAFEVCRALSYAHELREEHGGPMGVVHRDVSPPNVLISQRGEVKVTDFGLAKAATQLEKTEPGIVKGKFSYLSPEAVSGEEVDSRSDIFSLGVCLWEMLGARRLFLGDTDYDTVKLVHKAEIPSLLGQHPEVDAAFEEILHRALAKDPRERFQKAREFGDALVGYLFSRQMKVTPYEIAHLVKMTVEQRKSLPPQPAIIDKMIQEELARFTSLNSPPGVEFDPASVILSPDNEGSRPLDAAEFENPRDWFTGDTEIEDAVHHVTSEPPKGAALGWVDIGVETDTSAMNEPTLTAPSLPTRPSATGSNPVLSRPPGSLPPRDTRTSTSGESPGFPLALTLTALILTLALGLIGYYLLLGA